MGIPVGVIDNDGVSGLQVEPETSGSRTQQEEEHVRVGRVELGKQLTAIICLGCAIQT